MRSIVLAAVLVLGARDAAATCMQVEDGCSVCCAGPGECSTTCTKPTWRSDATSRFEIGASGVGARFDDNLGAGARISVGYQRLFGFNERLLGNELGVELGCERVWADGANDTLVSLTPILRVATTSRFRTASVFGVVLPEVGASMRAGAPTQMFFRWSAFPIDVRIGSRLAIAIEPIAFAVASGGGTRWWLSSNIGLRVMWEAGE